MAGLIARIRGGRAQALSCTPIHGCVKGRRRIAATTRPPRAPPPPLDASDLTDKLSGLADAALTAAETKIKADKPPTELDNATKQRKLAQEQVRIQLISKCLDNPELSFCQDIAKLPVAGTRNRPGRNVAHGAAA